MAGRAAFLLTLLSLLGCTPSVPSPSSSAPREVLVFAAASTTNAMDESKAAFQQQRSDVTVSCSYASSSVLAKQITSGAGADLFLSADTKWADFLAEATPAAEAELELSLGTEVVCLLKVHGLQWVE